MLTRLLAIVLRLHHTHVLVMATCSLRQALMPLLSTDRPSTSALQARMTSSIKQPAVFQLLLSLLNHLPTQASRAVLLDLDVCLMR